MFEFVFVFKRKEGNMHYPLGINGPCHLVEQQAFA